MAISFVQGTTFSGNTAAPASAAFGSNVTAGNAIVLYIVTQSVTTVSSMNDTLGNTYTNIYNNLAGLGGSGVASLYYALNITGGANTIRVTSGSGGWTQSFVAQEFSGVATASAADGNNHTSSSSMPNPFSSGSITTTNANDVIIGGFCQTTSSTFTAGSGYSNVTQAGSTYHIGMESQVVAAATSYNPQVTSSIGGFNGDAITFALKAAAGGGPAFIAASNKLPNQAVKRASFY